MDSTFDQVCVVSIQGMREWIDISGQFVLKVHLTIYLT